MADGSSSYMEEDYIVVAAIDFGTTYSGYAFSFKDKPDSINMNKNWGAERGADSYKTPTCVMTNPEGKFHSFGYEAEDDYFQMEQESGTKGYNLYRNFKMELAKKDFGLKTKIRSISGHATRALNIFKMSLEFLKDHMLKQINKAVKDSLNSSDIRWVITVPAIWTEEAKRFMRVAAYKAGLISTRDSSKLLIALEPEAASMFCRSVDVGTLAKGSDDPISFCPGEKMVIVDAGGGTVDITAHDLEDESKVKEIVRPSGGPWGGTVVDNKFVEILTRVLGSEFVEHMVAKNPQQWLHFMTNFERAKRSAKPDGKSMIKLSLPYAFNQEYRNLHGKDVEKAIKDHPEKIVTFANGYISLKPEIVAELFEGTCQQIVTHLKGLLRDDVLKRIDYMLLVGGYGESPFLKKECQQAFGDVCKLIVPYDAQLAIVKGAVLFGHKPLQISCRVSQFTYGCEAYLVFQEGKHDPRRSYISDRDGQKRCKHTFREFVKIGEEVRNPFIRSFTVHPSSKTRPSVNVALYKSTKKDVTYIDEEDVYKMREFVLTSPDGYLSEDIEIRVTFGRTELRIEGRDPMKGNELSVTMESEQ